MRSGDRVHSVSPGGIIGIFAGPSPSAFRDRTRLGRSPRRTSSYAQHAIICNGVHDAADVAISKNQLRVHTHLNSWKKGLWSTIVETKGSVMTDD